MDRLCKESSLRIRLEVAESEDTPIEILEQFAGDMNYVLREAVKYNNNCPKDVCERIEEYYQIAQNWDTEPQALASLAESQFCFD